MENKEKTKPTDTSIQTELSIKRTILANHRTFLSYLRSSAAILVAGAGLMKFIQSPTWVLIGKVCIILSPILLIAGFIDYILTRKLIKKEKEFLKEER